MSFESAISNIASLVGDATRSRMLAALMDGRAYTATELAVLGEVAPSTASSHLDRLQRGGLLAVVRQGRHRYYRIADPQVASAIEALAVTSRSTHQDLSSQSVDGEIRRARVCYDHLAGSTGVELFEGMLTRGLLVNVAGVISPSPDGEQWLNRLGVDAQRLRSARRPMCRTCLDWTERRDRLAGALGAALLETMLAHAYLRRVPGSRALQVTRQGATFLQCLRARG